MGFTVAMIGNEARPYAQTSEAQLIELGKERGVEVTIKCAAPRGCSLRRCSLFRRLFRFLRLLFVPSRSLSPASGSAARVASGSFSPCFAAHNLLLRAECRPCAGGWTRS